ncbi:MAG: hypothetical protein RR194_07250, partial [Ruthenibacterium sp.]
CWDLHRILLYHRSCLLAVHASSRYTFTVFDLSTADAHDLRTCFLQGLRRSFLAAGIFETTIERYLETAGALTLTKTHGRMEVEFLNRAWEDVLRMDHAVDRSQQEQPLLDEAVNHLPCRCAGRESPATAFERLRLDLASCAAPMCSAEGMVQR